EAASYQDVVQAMYDHHEHTRAIPSWLIMESRNRNRYPLGMQPPGFTPKKWIESGFVKKAKTLGDLARQCGVDASTFADTVRRFNQFAASGADADFHRTERAADLLFADPRHGPNPGLGAIE